MSKKLIPFLLLVPFFSNGTEKPQNTDTNVGKDVKINFKVTGGIANTNKGNGDLCAMYGHVNNAKIKGNVKVNFKVTGAIATTNWGNGKTEVLAGGVGQGSCK